MKFSKKDLLPRNDMQSHVYGNVTTHSIEDYEDSEGMPLFGVIKAGDMDRLSDRSRRELQALYSAALTNIFLAQNELPREIQTKIFQTGRLETSEDGLNVHVDSGTLAAPYNHAVIDALDIPSRPQTVGDLRVKPYDGSNVLLSGGVNNFVLSEEGEGDFSVSMLALQRNAISNDGITPLADALKLQGPGGGRAESV